MADDRRQAGGVEIPTAHETVNRWELSQGLFFAGTEISAGKRETNEKPRTTKAPAEVFLVRDCVHVFPDKTCNFGSVIGR